MTAVTVEHGPTKDDPIELMRQVVQLTDQTLHESLSRAGYENLTRGQLHVLQLVVDGAGSPGEITKIIGTTQQYVSKCLTILAAEGCVEHEQAGADRRRRHFRSTQRGLRAVSIARAWRNRTTASTSDDLAGLLASLLSSLTGDGRPRVGGETR